MVSKFFISFLEPKKEEGGKKPKEQQPDGFFSCVFRWVRGGKPAKVTSARTLPTGLSLIKTPRGEIMRGRRRRELCLVYPSTEGGKRRAEKSRRKRMKSAFLGTLLFPSMCFAPGA